VKATSRHAQIGPPPIELRHRRSIVHSYSIETAIMFRLRAAQAEAEARRATREIDREVFMIVAETWREIALAAARAQKQRTTTSPFIAGD